MVPLLVVKSHTLMMPNIRFGAFAL